MKIDSLKKLNQYYQNEIKEHKIKKNFQKFENECLKKNQKCDKYVEYEEYLEIGNKFNKITKNNKINKSSCNDIKKAIISYENELKKYQIFLIFNFKKKKELKSLIKNSKKEYNNLCKLKFNTNK